MNSQVVVWVFCGLDEQHSQCFNLTVNAQGDKLSKRNLKNISQGETLKGEEFGTF